MESREYHVPVLLEECLEGLNIDPNGVYVDVTFGGGGHSRAIVSKLDQGKLYGFDQDEDAKKNAIDHPGFKLIMQNFRYLRNSLIMYGHRQVDGILADLGVSSHQFDTAERGFSIRYEGPLDMRMNQTASKSAADILNNYSEADLTQIFSAYGEVRNSKTLARTIVSKREEKAFERTEQLIDLLKTFVKGKQSNKYFAQVFQALRIEVNEEMEVLKEFLKQAEMVLKPGGRLVVITYHSLEDRLVKQFIQNGDFIKEPLKDDFGNKLVSFQKVNRKPILPKEEELVRNTRSRSAKLRIAERLS
jgi:16S rRNA (cytosine1402-N4)-methyltransferase